LRTSIGFSPKAWSGLTLCGKRHKLERDVECDRLLSEVGFPQHLAFHPYAAACIAITASAAKHAAVRAAMVTSS
jgi:hypothetical protein